MKELHPAWKQKDFAKWLEDTHGLKVSQPTISKTLKRSIDHQQALSNPDAKRSKQVKYSLIESALYEWFVSHQTHVNLSGELLKEKGNIFLNQLYPEASFEFSNGWLEKFKQLHGIQSCRRFGESGSVDMEKSEVCLPSIKDELDKWAWSDIYNMDEMSLFYQMQTDNSLATKQLEGRKQNKERVAIVICCNSDGFDKLPFWIIGKFLNPRCFKNVNCDTLGCTYRANSNAWMTSLLFLEWLKWFDSRLDMNVLLILDNCTAHGKKKLLPPLNHTTVMFLPPNSTSKIQPCDAGIIRNFKDRVLEPTKISLLDGIMNATTSWSIDVKPLTIENCFKHCRIRTLDSNGLEVTNEVDEENKKLLTELSNQVKKFHYSNQMDMDVFLNHPSEQQITHILTEEEIIATIRQKAEGDDPEDDSVEIQKVSCQEALSMLYKLESFELQQDDVHVDKLLRTLKLKDVVTTHKIKMLSQPTIDKYFR